MMAEFTNFQNLKQAFSDINLLNNLSDTFDHHNNLHSNEPICLSNNNQPAFSLLHQQPINLHNDGMPSSSINPNNTAPVYDHLSHFYSSGGDQLHEDINGNNKTSESDFLAVKSNSSLSGSDLGRGKKRHNEGNEDYSDKKRKRNNVKEMEKAGREVVHVRAKRGQSTDSHSLAERVRREKINEKLRSLQNLVPGCYKTMGMAVMLDVIINYVRSLQNQIDFLSMKLSDASLYYDFNSPEIDGMRSTIQGSNSNNPYDANNGSERIVAREYAGFFPHVQTSWPL